MPKDDRLIYLLSKAQNFLKTYMKKQFDAHHLGITPVQAGIMFLLQKGGYTMTELSQILEIDNSAITGLVDRLEKSGLAQRTPNPRDRRAYIIQITEKGKREIEKAYVVVKQVNDEIKKGFTEQEIDTFKSVLNSFYVKFKTE